MPHPPPRGSVSAATGRQRQFVGPLGARQKLFLVVHISSTQLCQTPICYAVPLCLAQYAALPLNVCHTLSALTGVKYNVKVAHVYSHLLLMSCFGTLATPLLVQGPLPAGQGFPADSQPSGPDFHPVWVILSAFQPTTPLKRPEPGPTRARNGVSTLKIGSCHVVSPWDLLSLTQRLPCLARCPPQVGKHGPVWG